ncbi:secretory phospholipase A2 [Mytilus galloprovincialis]|uniref:Secretory phospholipase A2 n=1 Tax=Mytilus galloprovincialis TaxID=29158 RepID=A0A8B6DGL3_MYTGA|nr:secretory phospholipase A2 [Mytilus galloprovincialis]
MVDVFPTLLIVCLFTSSKASWDIIYPNTKWCGKGNTANNYDDLGSLDTLDSCCRTHDNCPININAFEKDYGILNIGTSTVSHCDCEDVLYECLRAIDGSQKDHATAVGISYFNVLHPKCIKKETKCVLKIWGNCIHKSSGYNLFSGRWWT